MNWPVATLLGLGAFGGIVLWELGWFLARHIHIGWIG